MEAGGKIIGIDLGTTNSVVAVMEGNEVIVIPNQEGANKTPSVVAFLESNECIVGEIARRQAATNPQRTISSIKRLMGQSLETLEEWSDRSPFQLTEYEGHLLIDINGYGYSPEQISALVLRKLKESAEVHLGEAVTQAVITVPAHFDDGQRSATIEAARLAELQVLRLINEPTAAALAYGLGKDQESEEVVAIYDFGGGTFDITILEISGKTFEVLTSTGDTRLGGDDLDELLVEMIVAEFKDRHGVDLAEDPVTLRRLKEVAEKAKCELSTASQTMITLPFIAYKDGTPLHLERQLSRSDFEELIEPFVNRTIRNCKRALDDAGLSKKDIGKVILVGGSTRIPLVQDTVEDFFGIQPFKGINPDEVVALGAAAQGGIFSGNIEEVTLLDVAPHSLGIEVKDGKFSRIIEKNATIPHKAAKNFTTTEDNQNFVVIHILQGENDEAAENRSLGKFILSDIPPQPRGHARIRVTFFVNADGVMEISAEELGSGVAKTLTIVHSDLDESERSARKRARRRRRDRKPAAPVERTAKRYKTEPAGTPADLRSRDAATVEKGDSSSDERPLPEMEPATASFDVLGDTNPGLSPTAHVGYRSSREAVPLAAKDTESKEESPPGAAPRRYSASHKKKAVEKAETEERTPDRLELLRSSADDIPTEEHFEDQPTERHHQSDLPTPVLPSSGFPEAAAETVVAESAGGVPLPPIVKQALQHAHSEHFNEKAHDAYEAALEVLSKDEWSKVPRFNILLARAELHIMTGESDTARDILATLSAKPPLDAVDDLERVLDKAARRLEAPAVFLRMKSRVREAAGNLKGACEDLEAAAKIQPEDSDVENLERLYTLRMKEGEDPAAQFKLVRIFLKSNRVDEAVEHLQTLVQDEVYETRALKILGLCHWQKNLHFLAWQKFKQLRQTEEIREILMRLGADMEATGQLSNALNVYEHIASETPDYRDVEPRIKKLRYRIKVQQEEADQGRHEAILNDPRFTIIEEINRGSMGIIFKARDKILDEVVALKVLNDYLCADPSAVERFKREARAAKKLAHPYIVRIHDMFESGNKRFISMEFIEGTDLKRMITDRVKFNDEQIVYYFLQVCDALAYAHRLNIIHRDIKPANVMITKNNTVKLTDFGIAKILKGEDSTKSGTAVIGTPLYMAPEQITGEGIDARTDIYAIGIMLYELLSGQPPFYLGNIEYHHIHTPPPPLPDSTPRKMRSIVMKCIEKQPANRFQSVDELYEELRA